MDQLLQRPVRAAAVGVALAAMSALGACTGGHTGADTVGAGGTVNTGGAQTAPAGGTLDTGAVVPGAAAGSTGTRRDTTRADSGRQPSDTGHRRQ